MKRIDCRGLACPKPVILTKKELDGMESGEIEVVVDNEAAKENVSKLAASMGLDCIQREGEGLYYITINKKSSECCSAADIANNRNITILVSSDKFGTGDDRLGAALMKSYMYALTESEPKPKTMLFVNSGVNLTTEGSDVIESLKALEGQGVEILSCGTCLDFYSLKEKLLIGTVTNMYTIVEKMNNSANTIKL